VSAAPRLWDLARDYAALSGGEALSKVAGFVAFAWLARVLEPSSYGALELAVAISMVTVLIVDFGLGPIGAREVTRQPDSALPLAGEIPALRLLLALIALAVTIGCAFAVTDDAQARGLILLFGLGLLGAPWTQSWLLQGLDQIRWVAPATLLRMGVFLIGVLLFVRAPDQVLRIGWLEVASAAAMALYFVAVTRWRACFSAPRFRPDALVRLAREAAPVGVSQLLWALNQYLPTLLIALLLSAGAVAFYGASHRIVMSLGTFTFLYFFNLYPSLVRTSAARDGSFATLMGHSFRGTAWLGMGAALGGTLLAEPICRLAYGPAFSAAQTQFAILIWALPVSLLSGHARFGLIASGHQRRELAAQAAGVVVTLGLGLLFVTRFGAEGAALAMVVSQVVVWGIAHCAARGPLGPLPWLRPLLGPLGAAVAAGLLASALPTDSAWLRTAVALGVYAGVGSIAEARSLGELRAALAGSGGDERATDDASSAINRKG
jgi:O-antigen/teichoic acid export membrane protein